MLFKFLAVTGIYACIGFSSYQLYSLLHDHGAELQSQNAIKFQFLFYLHIFVAVALGILLKLQDFYHQILCAFFLFLIVFGALFACEGISKGETPQEVELIREFQDSKPKLEEIYSDIYYLVYMYAILGVALTGMFIFVSEGMAWWQGPPVGRYDAFIASLDFNEAMHDEECPICLSEFTKDGRFSLIKKCGHVFHEDCLKQWIKYSRICPLDRANIVQ